MRMNVSIQKIWQLPHPEMHKRHFVLFPLFDIAPQPASPTGDKLADLIQQCNHNGLLKLPNNEPEITNRVSMKHTHSILYLSDFERLVGDKATKPHELSRSVIEVSGRRQHPSILKGDGYR